MKIHRLLRLLKAVIDEGGYFTTAAFFVSL